MPVADQVSLGRAGIDLIGRGNVWVEDSVLDGASQAVAQALIALALSGTTPGQLEVIVLDDSLTGVASPFQDVNGGGQKILDVLPGRDDLLATLAYLRAHIQGVNNVVQGRAPCLLEFRRQVDYPVESFKLVVLAADFSLLPERIQNEVAVLLKAGPRAGVTFLIHSMSMGVNEFLTGMCTHLTCQGTTVLDASGRRLGRVPAPGAQELIDVAQQVARQVGTTPMTPIAFSTVQDLTRPWRASSADGITFSLGRYGLSRVEVTLGDEVNQRHNVLVTGAVGQGKSNLVSVIVHSLCQRYSPEELELYLLDFKEGVTLKPLAPNGRGEFLPHARVLGLDADREYGVHVLRHLLRTYRRRMARFKETGVQSIRQYRALRPAHTMARILVVIDEFQMLFADNDSLAREAADLLVRSVRLFRAAGIHLLLASQTIGGNMALAGSAGDGLFSQIPVRIALKNSLTESHATLGVRNDAATHLRAREAIVNCDYGALDANRKVTIAYADEEVLTPLRAHWWTLAAGRYQAPEVFNGEAPVTIDADLPGLHGTRVPTLLLGHRVEVGTPVEAVALEPGLGRNLAVVGPGDQVAVLVAAARAVLATSPAGLLTVLLPRGLPEPDREAVRALEEESSRVGWQTRTVPADEVSAWVDEALLRPPARGLLLVPHCERLREVPASLGELLRALPLGGTHVLAGWSKLEAFNDTVGYGGESSFDVRLALGLDTQSTRRLMNDPVLEWRPRANRALAWDVAETAAPVVVIPYTRAEE